MLLRVKSTLSVAGVDCRIIKLKERAVSVEDVIEFSNEEINPEGICKTI